ncbi:MAG TPA: hypothetical protein VK012_05340 [Gemmatimonadales bacterium]|nr:hypothetical protein [Gemmatimonadales bacterium]
MHPIREARLKPEFATQYPGLEPGVWYPAATIAELLLTRDSTLRGPDDPPARPLTTEHFEFRGGTPGKDPGPDRVTT